jgi:hypothetical protein
MGQTLNGSDDVKIRRAIAAEANVQGHGQVLAGKRRLDGGGSRAGRTWRAL